MKICIVNHYRIHPPVEGAKIVTWETARHLAKRGHKVYVVSCGGEEGISAKIEDVYIIHRQWKLWHRLLFEPIRIGSTIKADIDALQYPEIVKLHEFDPHFASLFRSIDCDVVQCEQIWPFKRAEKVAKKLHVPLVLRELNIESYLMHKEYTYHGVHGFFTRASHKLIMNFEKNCCRKSDYVVTLSKRDEDIIRGWNVSNVTTIEPGLTIMKPSVTPDVKSILDIKGPMALFVGIRYPPNVEACKRILLIARKVPNVTFLIVGSVGEVFKGVDKPSNVVFAGHIPYEELYAAYLQADLVLIPIPWASGTQIKFIEALRYGKPAIVSSAVAKPFSNIVNGKHVIVEDDVNEYPKIINRLIKDKKSREALAFEAKEYSERFDWSRSVRRLENLYYQLVEKKA